MTALFKARKGRNFENIETLIAARVHIEGKLKAEGSVRLDGSIEGEVDIKGDVVVGEKGLIKGNIRVENILIGGSIEGNISASGRAEILPSGEVRGDVMADTLVIEEGGLFTGNSRMSRQKEGKRENRHKVTPPGDHSGKRNQGG